MTGLALRPPLGLKQGDINSIVRAHYGPRIVTMRPFDTWAGLYQDALGTMPVTDYGQPVGLALDTQYKLRRGLELSAALQPGSGWFSGNGSSVTYPSAGTMRITQGVANTYGIAQQELNLKTNALYELIYRVKGPIDVLWTFGITGTNFGFTYGVGDDGYVEYRIVHQPTQDGNQFLYVAVDSGTPVGYSIDVQFVSLREIPGVHWRQTSPQSRPLTAFKDGRKTIRFDGVDDFLTPVNLVEREADFVIAMAGNPSGNAGTYFDGLFQIAPIFGPRIQNNGILLANYYAKPDGSVADIYAAAVPGGRQVLANAMNADRTLFLVDGSMPAIGPAGKRMIKAGANIGRSVSDSAQGDYFTGDISALFIAQGENAGNSPAIAQRWARERKVLSLDDQMRGAFAGKLITMRAFNNWEGLYQDPEGTYPVTASGQPVALALDQNTKAVNTPRVGEITNDVVAATLRDAEGVYYKATTTGGPDPYFGHIYGDEGLGPGLVRYEVEVWGDSAMEGRLYVYDQYASIEVSEAPIAITTTRTRFSIIAFVPGGVFNMRVDGPDSRLGGVTPAGLTYYFRVIRAEFLKGTHWRQRAIQSRPLTKQVAGKKCISFDGVDDYLVAVGMPASADWSSFIAGLAAIAGQNQPTLDGLLQNGPDGNVGWRIADSFTNAYLFYNGGGGLNVPVVSGTPSTYVAYKNPSDVRLEVNGQTSGSGGASANSPFKQATLLGAQRDESLNAITSYYIGDIYGIALTAGPVDTALGVPLMRQWVQKTQE